MSAAIDLAVISALRSDSTIATNAPGGVWRDYADENVVDSALRDPYQVFGIVTLQSAIDRHAFTGKAFHECRYLVKFVSPSLSPTTCDTAAVRAETVLATLTASGFAVSCSRREERIAYVEVDGPVRWQHRGFSWLVVASPTS